MEEKRFKRELLRGLNELIHETQVHKKLGCKVHELYTLYPYPIQVYELYKKLRSLINQ